MHKAKEVAKKGFDIFWPILIVIILAAANISLLYLNTGNNLENTIAALRNFTPDKLKVYVESYGIFAPLIFVLLLAFQSVVAPIPSAVIIIAGGLIFGPLVATVLSVIGNLLGAILCFKIAEKLGRPIVERLISKERLKKVDLFFEKKSGFLTILLLRLNPITSSDALSYAAGLTKISLKDYIFATLLGIIPANIFLSYLGYELVKGQLWTLFAITIVLVVVVVIATIVKNKLEK
jgi:uncharacterized membrane protein YdjX (TVP38/TMEM64 family)